MAVIADKEDRAAVWQINLHAYQTVRVAWEVVKCDALAEVEAALVEGLPVPVLNGIVSQYADCKERSQRYKGTTHKSNFK